MFSEKLLIVNFGGPRSLNEIEAFLIALLTDRDVITSSFPNFIHRRLFTRIAKKRALKVAHDYTLIGGKSPIYEDTLFLAGAISKKCNVDFLTFHRYLPATHESFIEQMENEKETCWRVFPLFPQFSYTTTGSIARWFSENLSEDVVKRLSWIKSYPEDSAYITCMTATIQEYLAEHNLKADETLLLFSAHGLPQSYINKGDCYQQECLKSFDAIAKYFPSCVLTYQSRFGKEVWLKPYTEDYCKTLPDLLPQHKNVLFIPLSFTSDHVETLFEIEYQYLPLVRERGIKAYRLPALNRRADWIEAMVSIIQNSTFTPNNLLIKKT